MIHMTMLKSILFVVLAIVLLVCVSVPYHLTMRKEASRFDFSNITGGWYRDDSLQAPYSKNVSWMGDSKRVGQLADECDGHVNYRFRVDGYAEDLEAPQFLRRFCDKFHGKRVLFVGCSVMSQTFTSLALTLGAHPSDYVFNDVMEGNKELFVCEKFHRNVSFIFRRNAWALLGNSSVLWKTYAQECHDKPYNIPNVWAGFLVKLAPWEHLIKDSHAVVLNRGIHIQLNHERLIKELNDTFSALKGKEVFYIGSRVMPAQKQDEPIIGKNGPQCREVLPISTGFHHDDLVKQNEKIRNLTKSFEYVDFIDIHCLTLGRPDGLHDLVHTCMPGPIDWVDYLLVHDMIQD